MSVELFTRYMVIGPVTFVWWREFAAPFLEKKGWLVIDPSHFSYKSSYGFNPKVVRNHYEVRSVEYCLQIASAIVEYHGEPKADSHFFPASGCIVIHDLLAFISLYWGGYCQYLWKERRRLTNGWSASPVVQMYNGRHEEKRAGHLREALGFFEQALATIPTLNKTQSELAVRWFLSALREYAVGRPLVEAALNWVTLEAQANILKLPGSKFQKVERLLANQSFPQVSHLQHFYQLRNDAFHDGKLSNLSEQDAQAARTAGRGLVRAQILNLLGMDHSNFAPEFVKQYA